MTLEAFQIIVQMPDGREALTFIEMSLQNSHVQSIWGCYPKSLHDLRKVDKPLYGCGTTPLNAFRDLYFKTYPDMINAPTLEF